MGEIGIREIVLSVGSLRTKIIKLLDLIVGSLIAILVPLRKDKRLDRGFIRHILIIRPGGIGDAVFLIPFLRSLKKSYPTIAIDVLCEKRNREIFASQKHLVNKVYGYDSLDSFLELWRNKFDVIVDTEQWHILSALAAYFLFPKHTIGFATRGLQAKLFHEKIDYDADAYEIENFKRLFASLLPHVDQIKDINNCFEIDEKILEWAKSIVDMPTAAIFLGASIAIRRLNKSQSLSLVQFLLEKGFRVLLVGGNDVVQAGRGLEEEISNRRLKNFIGKASLIETAALIKQSKVFIGPDSGLMHLSCAVGIPTIAIFGPGNLKKWTPKGEQHSIVTENVECSPCTHFGYTVPTCRGSYHCMRNIKVADIFLELSRRI